MPGLSEVKYLRESTTNLYIDTIQKSNYNVIIFILFQVTL